ncbi:hypothetical protein [Bradyrhizobium sp. CB3481]|uniref:hypothetical protein n=1 Tax=Bradyrhizobium sp. CB3481 TaxID=3039158 RepID=UPI0024B0E3E4|nr:hypothetical protein [Bradyrhizobium sp. CB3481]WFU16441.1 hypothetical protein QA643_36785 [Bradyrhizobium sp. CB3481]
MFGRALNFFSLFCALAAPAYASCDQSFDVDPKKTISSMSVLVAMPEADATHPISCSVAEKYREYLFVNGATKIGDKDFADLKAYQKTMSAQRAVLEQAIKDATPNPTRILVDVALMEYGKYSAILTCFAPDVTVSKAVCSVGLGIAMLGSYDLVNNTGKASTNLTALKTGLASHDALFKQEMDRKEARGVTEAQARLKSMYSNMCQAIQKNCLK